VETTTRSVTYKGIRTLDGRGGEFRVVVELIGPREKAYKYPLKPRNDLFNHSPDGFAWGYEGSGPAQLALALLAHHLEKAPDDVVPARLAAGVDAEEKVTTDELAAKLHQRFKAAVVAGFKYDEGWELRSDDISRKLRELAGRRVGDL
jgi:hypothetical protein